MARNLKPTDPTPLRDLDSMNALSDATNLLHIVRSASAEDQPDAYGALASLYERGDEATRFTIVNGLVELHSPIALPLFRHALRADPNEVVRHEAAVGLGSLGDTDSLDLLCLALDDPSSLVRHEAALALGDVGDERHLSLLQQHLQEDKPEVVISCRVAIARIEHRRMTAVRR